MAMNVPDRRILRERLIAARESLDPATHARLSSLIVIHVERLLAELEPSTLGFCWPFRREVDLVPMLTRWHAARTGRRIALPLVTAAGKPLAFRAWAPGDDLVPDRYGIPIAPAGAPVTPTLLLIPVNGFDARGYRIGYGAGYFDRTLAALCPTPVTVGVGFELARLDRIAEEAHDRPLDWVVTEAGCVVSSPSKRG